jgi:hypothetical protein
MKRWIGALSLLTLATAAVGLAARTDAPAAARALSTHSWQSDPAIAELRAAGQPGVDALVAASSKLTTPEDVARFRTALDRVCKQRDCYASHLYWYTDLTHAKAAARATGRPILSLRLLGQLDDELSCANSRFFRTTLYANAKIAKTLRENFVLHWSSERPVPKVTVDFGDGRKICSTVTGNSAHYLLDAGGNPLDVVPGLYSPDAFLAQLGNLQALYARYARLDRARRDDYIREYHVDQMLTAMRVRDVELQNLGKARVTPLPVMPVKAVRASKAAPVAQTKMVLEVPILADLGQPIETIADSDWKAISASHAAGVRFDAASLALMKEKASSFQPAMLARLQRTVAEDTLRNEYDLHLRIHQWYANGRRPTRSTTLESLNKRVYAELFLTPAADPWLGLKTDDAFSAISGGGVVGPSK